MTIHSMWRLSNTFYMLAGDVRTISCWVRTITTERWCGLQPRTEIVHLVTSQILWANMCVANTWWRIHITIPIHIIWRLSNTFYMLEWDVRTIWRWVRAITTAQWGGLQPSTEILLLVTSQICWANTACSGSGKHMTMDPYDHPQHMKVVNRLLYVGSGRGYEDHFMLG